MQIDAGAEPLEDLLAQRVEAAEVGVRLGPGRRQHDAGQPLGVLDRQHLRDGAAGRMADHMSPADFERIQQPDGIDRHPLDGVAHSRRIALPDAAVIEGDDLEPLAEGGHLFRPERRKPAESRNEQDGEAHALALVIERALSD